MPEDQETVEVRDIGDETVCRSTDCIHNDCPVCKVHTKSNPIVIEAGRCVRYERE